MIGIVVEIEAVVVVVAWNDIERDIERDIVCIGEIAMFVFVFVFVFVGAMIEAMEIVIVIVNALEMNDVRVVFVAMEYAMSDCDVFDFDSSSN